MPKKPNLSTDEKKRISNRRKRKRKQVILDFSGNKNTDTDKNPKPKPKTKKNTISLTTSFNDYGGAIELPEKVAQRENETVGQFMRRLDRLVAKAKVEASIGSRFGIETSRKTR